MIGFISESMMRYCRLVLGGGGGLEMPPLSLSLSKNNLNPPLVGCEREKKKKKGGGEERGGRETEREREM